MTIDDTSSSEGGIHAPERPPNLAKQTITKYQAR